MDHYIAKESALKDYSDYLLKYGENVYEKTCDIIYILEKLEWQDKIYDRIVDLVNELIKKINAFLVEVDSNAYVLDKMHEVILRYHNLRDTNS